MKRDLTVGSVTPTMLRFALPMICGNLLQQCYNLADTWIVGHFLGAGALAAVGSAYTLMTFLTSILIGLCMGSGALLSICYGRKDLERMRRYMRASFVLVLGITAALMLLSHLLLEPILRLLQTPEEIFGEMHSYMRAILWGLGFVCLYNYFAFLQRSVGNSALPLLFLGLSTATNIALDVLFVAALDLGVAGAAWATVLAQALAGLGLGICSLFREPLFRPRRGEQPPTGGEMGEILQYAVATGVQQSVMNFGILMVQGLVNSFGTAVMAAFAAGVKIDTLAYMPAQEFGNAYSIFIAQNHGAGKTARIRSGNRCAAAVVVIFCVVVSAAVFVLARPLMEIFIDPWETEILDIGVGYLRVEGAFYWGIGLLFLLYGYFRAVERPRVSLLLTGISLGTRVALAYALAPGLGVEMIWWAVPIGWALADAVGLALIRRTGKKAVP